MTTPLRCVVDASVGIKKFIIEPITPKVDQLFAHLTDSVTLDEKLVRAVAAAS
ncbi:hypothetical protein H6F61_14235 [Cyanobacteria bacterium FACHB-472]|nr:hypothetical protein [Cyanobacteria bacterium FACHB-472]